MLDHGEADDKLVGVLLQDLQWGEVEDIADLPDAWIDRLRHYFTTYKALPDESNAVKIGDAYGRAHAERVIRAGIADYEESFASAAKASDAGKAKARGRD
jgi:inorganic pyrophosphatase